MPSITDTALDDFVPTGDQVQQPDLSPAPQAEQQPQPQSVPTAFDFIGDEYWGQGGRFIFDPATGKRRPAGE
ncbi:MAG: hypothetical protein HGA47_06865 [Zoogloea sp.]|nr:hypothetical protein [Zoogloea sp.]